MGETLFLVMNTTTLQNVVSSLPAAKSIECLLLPMMITTMDRESLSFRPTNTFHFNVLNSLVNVTLYTAMLL